MIELLYYRQSSAGMPHFLPHLLLEEIGEPYCRLDPGERVVTDLDALAAQRGAHGFYCHLHDGPVAIGVPPAMVLYLCEKHPAAGLAPRALPARAAFFTWLGWLGEALASSLAFHARADLWAERGDPAVAAGIRRQVEHRVQPVLRQFASMVSTRDWLLGRDFSALDLYLFTLCHWSQALGPAGAQAMPALAAYLGRVGARPGVRRVLADERIVAA